MRLMIARPAPLVTTSGEPEPQPDRPTGTPHTLLSRLRLLRASTPAEIHREDESSPGDDGLGYERDETDNRLLLAEGGDDRPPLPQREPGKTLEDSANPEYACDVCNGWHSGACPAALDRNLGQLLTRIVVETDTRVPHGRRARRTLTEMAPGYTRQPVLLLTRPVRFRAANDACAVCGSWSCTGNCWQNAPVPAGAGVRAGGSR